MNRRIDDRELVQLLRHAGTDVELDVARILQIVDGASPEGRAHPIRPPIARLQRRSPLQLLALPMAAAMAIGLVMAIKGVAEPKPERIEIVTGRTASDGATPTSTPTIASMPTVTSTSKLGDATSITAPTQPAGNSPGSARGPAGGRAGSTAPSAPKRVSSGWTSIEVAPVRQGTAFRLPMHASHGWLLVGSATNGSQPHSNVGGVDLGPAQVMGTRQTVEVGPYDVSWAAGSAGTSATRSGTWLAVPGIVRGAQSGLRIPVRVHRTPARITLLTGTVGGGGGGGRVTVNAGQSPVTAELPSCTQAICPAVVTVTLDPTTQQSGITVMIELNGTGADSKVGLAAVELG